MKLPRNTKAAGWCRSANSGQASVEYALVFAAFMALVVAFGALWQVLGDGLLVQHALGSASHHVQGAFEGGASDVFMY